MNIEEQRKQAAEIAQEIGARVDEALAARSPLAEYYRGERNRLRDNIEHLIDYTAASAHTSEDRNTTFRDGMAAAYRDMNAKLIVAKCADFKEGSGSSENE